jgi:aminopeptidase N
MVMVAGPVRSAGIGVLVLMVCGVWSASYGMHHAIRISLFPPDNSLLAVDSVSVDATEIGDHGLRFLINKALTVEDITADVSLPRWYTQERVDPRAFRADADSEDIDLVERAKGVFVELGDDVPESGPVTLAVHYSGVIYDSLRAPSRAYARGFSNTEGLIDERGVFLTGASLWYPFQFDRMSTFRLHTDLPSGWMAVSQGDLRSEYADTLRGEERVFDLWVEDNPAPEIYLVAGKYFRHEEMFDGTWIMTYTYEEADSLCRTYLDATKRYIGMYEGLIGNYPYAKFALVENFWQTGFGMPSFTLLGSRVIRLPFIVHTSYGHEILHNWWGNSVFVDYGGGNWCEGLTTYGADYLYKEQASEQEARDYRHHTLMDFSNYVPEDKDFPLSKFRERHDAASQSVGYGKSLMVFHMLRKSLDDSVFWACLRQFYMRHRFTVASWQDLGDEFSQVSGLDLSWYFDQWVGRTGAPAIRLVNADYVKDGETYQVRFSLEQNIPPYRIDVPVRITTTGGTEDIMVRLESSDSTYQASTRTEPVALAVDPDYDTFRRLYIEEMPMTLGGLFGQDSVVVIIGEAEDDSTRAAMRRVARAWGLDAGVIEGVGADDQRLRRNHLWLLGRGPIADAVLGLKRDRIDISGYEARVQGSPFLLQGGTLVCTVRNPHNESLGVGLVLSDDPAALEALANRLPHYGRYSYIGFKGDAPILRGVWAETRSPLVVDFQAR